MSDTTQIGWYEIAKDIIIPSISIFATIVLGTIIAGLLRRKEEKAQIKSLLIDNYMQYLTKRANFVQHESLQIANRLLGQIYHNFSEYFERHANAHFQLQRIKKRIEKLEGQISEMKDEDYNWSVYTYKFAFLLTKKRYNKEAQGLEDKLISDYFGDQSHKALLSDIKTQIKSKTDIVDAMAGLSDDRIDKALTDIEAIVAKSYASYQRQIFQSYDNRIADLIDKF